MSEILDVHGVPIDPVWAAEFRGFFLGEGSLQIQQYQRSKQHSKARGKVYDIGFRGLRPVANITQRRDNRATLEAIAARLGGHVTNGNAHKMVSGSNGKTYTSAPMVAWRLVNKEGMQRVIALLKGGSLPHTKLAEIDVIERYLAVAPPPGYKYSEAARAEAWALFEEIKRVREYHE